MSQKHDQTLKALQLATILDRTLDSMGERRLTERQVAVISSLLARMTSVEFLAHLLAALRLTNRRERAKAVRSAMKDGNSIMEEPR